EFDFLGPGETDSFPLQLVANERLPPFAKEQVAAVLRREVRVQIADSAGGGAEAEVGERGNGFVRAFIIKVRIAVVGSEEAVAEADFVVAAVVLVVPDEDVELGVESHVVDVPQAGGKDMQVPPV